ncbi:MAG: alpha/beta hydrolase-fold protein, partial [Flavobacteriales bacterium]
MKSLFTTVTFLLFAFAMVAQMTVIVDDVPAYFMPQWDNIYLAGNFNNWNAGDDNYLMQPSNEGYSITISGTPGEEIAFKFTRGTWESVETQADGSFLADRTTLFQDGATVTCQVAGWEDFAGTHTATDHVLVLDSDQLLPELNRTRRIWVCLPPDYHLNDEHYPVLYLQDGQNVFDSASSFSGEWQVDETMSSLPEICSQAIVVAIDNGEEHRI